MFRREEEEKILESWAKYTFYFTMVFFENFIEIQYKAMILLKVVNLLTDWRDF